MVKSKEISNVEKEAVIDSLLKEMSDFHNKELKESEKPTAVSMSDKPRMIIESFNDTMERASKMETPKMLFSELWHEGELCLLFADTNIGKTVLAMNIATSISSGISVKGFKLTAKAQKVVYFDYELSEKQVERRYSYQDALGNTIDSHKFSENFFRATVNHNSDQKSEGVLGDIEDAIKKSGASVFIIDNLTALGAEMEQAKNAIVLMKGLLRLKEEYKCSILVIAHTPKRDNGFPITKNNLAGSAVIGNLADSMFALGSSNRNDQRYIKQIKQRFTEQVYGADNVITCELVKHDTYLSLDFKGFDYEEEHLKVVSLEEKQEIREDIYLYKKSNPSMSIRALARHFDATKSFIEVALKKGKENESK